MKYFRKLEGEHVYLSPMNLEDAEQYAKWLNNKEINQYLNIRNSLISLPGENDYLEKFTKEEFNLSIVRCDNDKLIGNIALKDIDYKNGNAELGIFIGDVENLSKGYGSEAIKLLTNYGFKELRLHTIFLTVFAENPRAKKAYEKCGFVEFGRRHEALFYDGKYHDLIYMELINKE
jgi:RimJ/RimL family protein N-acetyltransferase